MHGHTAVRGRWPARRPRSGPGAPARPAHAANRPGRTSAPPPAVGPSMRSWRGRPLPVTRSASYGFMAGVVTRHWSREMEHQPHPMLSLRDRRVRGAAFGTSQEAVSDVLPRLAEVAPGLLCGLGRGVGGEQHSRGLRRRREGDGVLPLRIGLRGGPRSLGHASTRRAQPSHGPRLLSPLFTDKYIQLTPIRRCCHRPPGEEGDLRRCGGDGEWCDGAGAARRGLVHRCR